MHTSCRAFQSQHAQFVSIRAARLAVVELVGIDYCPRFPLIHSCRNKGVLTQTSRNKGERCLLQGLLTQSCRDKGELCMWVSCIDSDPCVHREIHQTRSNGYPFFLSPNQDKTVVSSYYARSFPFVQKNVVTTSKT